MTRSDPLTLSVEECAARLGIGRSLAYSLVTRGEIPSVRFGRLRRIPIEGLEEWLRQESDASYPSGRPGGSRGPNR